MHELSNGQSSTLSHPTGNGGGVGITVGGVAVGSGRLVVGRSVTGCGSSEDGPSTGWTGTSGYCGGLSVTGERVGVLSVLRALHPS